MASAGYIYLGASPYALRILRELVARSASRPLCLIDVGLDDARRRALADELGGAVRAEHIHDAACLRDPAFLARLRAAAPALALSAHFSQLLSPDFLAIPRHGVANLHSGLLPYNRGHWPEIWSIVRGTPAGITLHLIGEGIDTGDVIDQQAAPVRPEDTCASLAATLEELGVELVLRNWEAMLTGDARAQPQAQRLPLNLHKHVEQLAEIHLERKYTGKELIDLLRALTLPRLLKGAFFVDPDTGDRIRLQLTLTRESAAADPALRLEQTP
ncbi:MAG: formyltransferase family protein [Kofleriaceae bacterium]